MKYSRLLLYSLCYHILLFGHILSTELSGFPFDEGFLVVNNEPRVRRQAAQTTTIVTDTTSSGMPEDTTTSTTTTTDLFTNSSVSSSFSSTSSSTDMMSSSTTTITTPVSESTTQTSTTTTQSTTSSTTDTTSSTTQSTSSTTDTTSSTTQSTSSTTDTTSSSTTRSTTTTTSIVTTTTSTTTTTTPSSSTLSTTTTTSTTTTGTASTTASSSLYTGSLDASIKTEVLNSQSGLGVSKSIESTPLSFMSDRFSQIQVYEKGFVTLGSDAASFSRVLPYVSLSVTFPLIAPFWSDFFLDSESDILFGLYNKAALNNDASLRSSIANDIASYLGGSTFTPEAALIITWKNVKPSSALTSQKASFQVAFVQSYSTGKTYIVFNYDQSTLSWTNTNNNLVLLGYTNGVNALVGGISRFSNTDNSNNVPTDVFNTMGNTNKVGVNVYDVSYVIEDKCESWYYKTLASSVSTNLQNAINTKNYVDCPSVTTQVDLLQIFTFVNTGYWQTGVECYKLQSGALVKDQPQHLCCYDTTVGNLVQDGSNAGFLYYSDDEDNVLQAGTNCCRGREWASCSRFYEIYPYNTDLNYVAPVSASGLGDPQVLTFDGLSYAFNGLGRYILSKTKDSSFEIQAETELFQNVDNEAITGTFFISFAMRTSSSKIIELRLSNSKSLSPYLMLYIDKVKQSDFETSPSYFTEFPSSRPEVSVKKTENNKCLVIFDNGVYIEISISTVSLNQTNKISWITCNINLLDTFVREQSNNLIGLMGNLNRDQNDDVFSRTNTRPSNMTSERAIYQIASSWALLDTEVPLFAPPISSRDLLSSATFVPSFADELVVSEAVKQVCGVERKCIVDAMLTGVKEIGASTQNTFQTQQTVARITNNKPPIIQLRQEVVQIDTSQLNEIEMIADVFDNDSGDLVKIEVQVTGAAVYTVLNVPSTPVVRATVSIKYTPKKGEYPIFRFIAIDSYQAASTNVTQIRVCDCKSVDSESQCRFDSTLLAVNAFASIVQCQCSAYYSGSYCNNTIDYCSLFKPCSPISSDYNIAYTCRTFTIAEQKSTNRTYFCDGTCPNLVGYSKDVNGFCLDRDECLSASTCPSGATCQNSIGSFTCKCPSGFQYANGRCEDVNECALNMNSCESICVNTEGSFRCECYFGYNLVDGRRCVKDTSVLITGCVALNCSQICTLDAQNSAICKCNSGFDLDTDQKSCIDRNECSLNTNGCSHQCVNTVGSFYCQCPIGRILDSDMKTCKICSSNTYGTNCSRTCNCINALTCNPVSGCICIAGYTGAFCETDINECLASPQYYYSSCINTPGGFNYQCEPGFEKRINDNFNCFDINECVTPNICPVNSVCNNTPGSYNCNCFTGWRFDTTTKTCVDVNECLNATQCPANSLCTNLVGSYRCDCNSGYSKTSDSSDLSPRCNDINECLNQNQNQCRYNEKCENTIGSFVCTCLPGYGLNILNKTCEDFNECEQNPCSTNATCINTDGSFLCPCKQYYVLVDNKCLFQERNVNFIQFQLVFKNSNCNNSSLSNLTDIVQRLYASLNLTTTVNALSLGCNNGTEVVQLRITFNEISLKPNDETQAIMLMTRNFNNIALLNGGLVVPINSSDTCVVYNTYNLCQNGGFCAIINNQPTCECPSFTKQQYAGLYCESINMIATTSAITTKKPVDDTVLVVAIVLPCIAFIIILTLSCIAAYYCYRRRMMAYGKHSDDASSSDSSGVVKIPRILNILRPRGTETIKRTLERSDFDFNEENASATGNANDLINFDDVDASSQVKKNEYRVAYPLEKRGATAENDYLKSLEANASVKQTSTIGRPHSAYSASLPISYHEKTTPYADYNDATGDDLIDASDVFGMVNPYDDDEDDDFTEVIEAINPNIQIPRPKVQKAPLNIFK